MNWESIFTEAIIGLVGFVITVLGSLVTYWISTKIKDEKLKGILQSLHGVVKDSVLEVYQTYVEELKCKNAFDREAQKTALSRAMQIIETNMSQDVKEWLKSNVSDVQEYIKGLIESQIALLKK